MIASPHSGTTADSSTFAIEKQLGLKPHVAVNLISHRQPVETVYTAAQGWFSGAASPLQKCLNLL